MWAKLSASLSYEVSGLAASTRIRRQLRYYSRCDKAIPATGAAFNEGHLAASWIDLGILNGFILSAVLRTWSATSWSGWICTHSSVLAKVARNLDLKLPEVNWLIENFRKKLSSLLAHSNLSPMKAISWWWLTEALPPDRRAHNKLCSTWIKKVRNKIVLLLQTGAFNRSWQLSGYGKLS